jgi:hypothetical protein
MSRGYKRILPKGKKRGENHPGKSPPSRDRTLNIGREEILYSADLIALHGENG